MSKPFTKDLDILLDVFEAYLGPQIIRWIGTPSGSIVNL